MAKAPAKKKAQLTAAAEGTDLALQSSFYQNLLDSELDVVEKKFKLNASSFYRDEKRLSTGLLCLDLLLNGGIVSGGWYTIFGGEQSCKSTLASWILGNLLKQNYNGAAAHFDYEGSSDPDYLANIMKSNKVKGTVADLFGQQDPETGEWIKRGKVRYYAPTAAETFFDWLAGMQRRLPDKVKIGKEYYLTFENTKANRKLVGDSYDKAYFSKHNVFKVPALDKYLQALVVLDSYPAMLPERLDEDDPGSGMAAQARMFSEEIKRVKSSMRRKMVTVVGVNQLRLRPAVMYGSPEYEPCGEALKFFSDVRIRMQARASSGAPSGWDGKDDKGVVIEKAMGGKGRDRYRFISLKTHKNKLGGVPNQETWLRLWISDKDGQARGFDPVFDTYNFLKTLGWVSGTKANFKFAEHCPLHGAKKLSWQDFKVLVLGNKEEIKEVCNKVGVKPVSIRLWCRKQIDNGKAFDRFKDIIGGDDVADDGEE